MGIIWRKLISNSGVAGFSLTEVMIGGAVLAGVALASAQLFKDQKLAQKRIEYDQKLSIFHQNLSKNLNNPANCNTTLKQLATVSAGGTIPAILACSAGCIDPSVDVSSYDAYTPGAFTAGTPIVSQGAYIDNTEIWRLTRIQVNPRSVVVGVGSDIIFKLDYTLNPKIQASKTVTKEIVVSTRFNGSSFRQCLSPQETSVDNLQNDLCYSLNLGQVPSDGVMARWDDTTQSCIVDAQKNCSAAIGSIGMYVDAIGTDGVSRCKPIVTAGKVNQLTDPSNVICGLGQVPQVYYDVGAKKMRIRCAP